MFLAPALLVMAIITFYRSSSRSGCRSPTTACANLRVNSPAPNMVGLENYQRILDNNIVPANFDFIRILVFNLFWAFSNVVLHVCWAWRSRWSSTSKGCASADLRRCSFLPVVIPPIIVARSGGTCSTLSTAPSTSC